MADKTAITSSSIHDAVEADDAKKLGEAVVRHYVPATEEEKHLDKRINAKLDAVVLSILAISFIVSKPANQPSDLPSPVAQGPGGCTKLTGVNSSAASTRPMSVSLPPAASSRTPT
jgi:hypothetical protein